MSIATAPESPGDRLVSGEAVELDVRVARLGSRALALIIDAFGQVVLFIVLVMLATMFRLVADSAGLFDDGLGQAVFTVILVITVLGYPAFFETVLRGRTPARPPWACAWSATTAAPCASGTRSPAPWSA